MLPMRRLVALSVIIALLLALVRAPFFHLHGGRDHDLHEPGHDNLVLVLHTHFEPSSTSSPFLVDSTHAGRLVHSVDILLVEQPDLVALAIQGVDTAFFSPLVPVSLRVDEHAPRAHDPPAIRSSIPRSPPA